MNELSPTFKNENLRRLRRILHMTQKDFIEKFLADDGTASMSIATLSNLEAKGGPQLNKVLLKVSNYLGVDVMLFSMPPEQFEDKIRLVLPGEYSDNKGAVQKPGSINSLLNQLTMYFAESMFENKLRKGDKIESDRELAVRFGVGRSAIREALKVLDVLGMIDICPGQGTYIGGKDASFFVIPLSWSLFLEGYQVNNILEVRNLLEVQSAYLAAERMEEKDCQKLAEVLDGAREALATNNHQSFLEADLSFHLCIAECSGNPMIYRMIQTISNLMRLVSGSGMVSKKDMANILEEHQKIYNLIAASDKTGAESAMRKHLKKSFGRYNY